MKKIVSTCISLITLFIGFSYTLCSQQSTLKHAYYLKEPNERLVFEFSTKPRYEISKDVKKLILRFPEVYIANTDWLRTLPRDVFKEFNISYEKNTLTIEISSHRDFNFQASTVENRLFIDIMWEKDVKPVMAVVNKHKVNTLQGTTYDLPKYQYPIIPTASSPQLPFTKNYNGTPISVDFQEADLHAVLRLLAEVGNLNIIVSEKVKGSVTLRLKQVPWDQILDIILANYGLAMLQIDNVIRIAPLDDIKAESDRYKDYLSSLKDIQEKGPLVTKTFQLKYVKGDVLSQKLKDITSGESKITFEPHSNTLIIKATEKNLSEIEKIIKEIDKPSKQVLIEARVVEVKNDYAHSLGIRWGGTAYKGTEHTIIGIGRSPSISTGSPTYTYPGGGGPGTATTSFSFPAGTLVDLGVAGYTNLGFVFGHIGKSVTLLDVQLSALESQGVARVFSKPKILTLDNQEAEIKQGYRVPYLQLTPQGNATTQFIDAVLRLKVTPHVTPDNRISLDVEIEKSRPNWGITVLGVPAMETKYAKTKVLINSGDTLVIGGIKEDETSEANDQVPGLSNLPFLGQAFKKRERKLGNTELMVFITPKIVSVEIPGVDY